MPPPHFVQPDIHYMNQAPKLGHQQDALPTVQEPRLWGEAQNVLFHTPTKESGAYKRKRRASREFDEQIVFLPDAFRWMIGKRTNKKNNVAHLNTVKCHEDIAILTALCLGMLNISVNCQSMCWYKQMHTETDTGTLSFDRCTRFAWKNKTKTVVMTTRMRKERMHCKMEKNLLSKQDLWSELLYNAASKAITCGMVVHFSHTQEHPQESNQWR